MQKIAELEVPSLKLKQRFSEQLSEMKITNAEEAARLTDELREMKNLYANK